MKSDKSENLHPILAKSKKYHLTKKLPRDPHINWNTYVSYRAVSTKSTHWQTVSNMKLIIELWSNAAKNEKLFLRNHRMLATDFYIQVCTLWIEKFL